MVSKPDNAPNTNNASASHANSPLLPIVRLRPHNFHTNSPTTQIPHLPLPDQIQSSRLALNPLSHTLTTRTQLTNSCAHYHLKRAPFTISRFPLCPPPHPQLPPQPHRGSTKHAHTPNYTPNHHSLIVDLHAHPQPHSRKQLTHTLNHSRSSFLIHSLPHSTPRYLRQLMTPRFRPAWFLQNQPTPSINTPAKTPTLHLPAQPLIATPPFLPLTVRLPGFSDAIDEDDGVLDGAGVDAATAPPPCPGDSATDAAAASKCRFPIAATPPFYSSATPPSHTPHSIPIPTPTTLHTV
jgi:hypothetical protein